MYSESKKGVKSKIRFRLGDVHLQAIPRVSTATCLRAQLSEKKRSKVSGNKHWARKDKYGCEICHVEEFGCDPWHTVFSWTFHPEKSSWVALTFRLCLLGQKCFVDFWHICTLGLFTYRPAKVGTISKSSAIRSATDERSCFSFIVMGISSFYACHKKKKKDLNPPHKG